MDRQKGKFDVLEESIVCEVSTLGGAKIKDVQENCNIFVWMGVDGRVRLLLVKIKTSSSPPSVKVEHALCIYTGPLLT